MERASSSSTAAPWPSDSGRTTTGRCPLCGWEESGVTVALIFEHASRCRERRFEMLQRQAEERIAGSLPPQWQRQGDRQYRRENLQYRPKSKPSSVSASDVDQKSEGKVEPAAEEKQAENVRKAKEAAAKEAKPRKAISIQEYLKPEDGSEYVPPTPPRRPQNGGYRGGRGNGAYNGCSSRDSSSECRVYNAGRGHNSIVFHNAEAKANANDSGAPRRVEGYNGEHRQGGYHLPARWQGGYYQERRDACNGDRREQGRYNGGGRGNGGYQERRDAYNGNRQEQGRYNGGRGNGYQQHQDGYNGYRGGYYNSGRGNGGYHQGGNYRQRQAPKPKEEDKVVITEADFPALGGASHAQSQA
uniref:Uncharacterized protein n=1 Tax=Triticum aestivum TaxID=4565 RepID=A0A077S1I5_WHEAT|nr:unnamed protein product [Triticum aestivum]